MRTPTVWLRAGLGLSALAVAAGSLTAGATAAGPPPPTSTNGKPVQLVAAGMHTPTSFAFGAGVVFAGDGGTTVSPTAPPAGGGVYVLRHGTATKLAGSPPYVAGVAWRNGTLYISAGDFTSKQPKSQILAWSGWNGSRFTKRRAIFTAPKGFDGFNGLAFGQDGRLYVGVDVGYTNGNDHGPASTSKYLYDILSMTATGEDLKVFARGMRQPWQMAFPKGSNSPFVSNLGQDSGATNPPDFLLRVTAGDNFGFPKCNWTKPKACRAFTKPFKMFAPHTDVMGVGIIGSRLYLSEFLGNAGRAGLVVTMPEKGGSPTTLMTGFVAPVVGLATNGGYVYVGELTGQVFRVKAS